MNDYRECQLIYSDKIWLSWGKQGWGKNRNKSQAPPLLFCRARDRAQSPPALSTELQPPQQHKKLVSIIKTEADSFPLTLYNYYRHCQEHQFPWPHSSYIHISKPNFTLCISNFIDNINTLLNLNKQPSRAWCNFLLSNISDLWLNLIPNLNRNLTWKSNI